MPSRSVPTSAQKRRAAADRAARRLFLARSEAVKAGLERRRLTLEFARRSEAIKAGLARRKRELSRSRRTEGGRKAAETRRRFAGPAKGRKGKAPRAKLVKPFGPQPVPKPRAWRKKKPGQFLPAEPKHLPKRSGDTWTKASKRARSSDRRVSSPQQRTTVVRTEMIRGKFGSVTVEDQLAVLDRVCTGLHEAHPDAGHWAVALHFRRSGRDLEDGTPEWEPGTFISSTPYRIVFADILAWARGKIIDWRAGKRVRHGGHYYRAWLVSVQCMAQSHPSAGNLGSFERIRKPAKKRGSNARQSKKRASGKRGAKANRR